ncbi:MAG: hypothetical protein N0E48_03785 [Candidatus Thiodiazotropha endolucinida]|nr:hypothetical protein [Candidatus Thiodiazotropha endolucinida]
MVINLYEAQIIGIKNSYFSIVDIYCPYFDNNDHSEELMAIIFTCFNVHMAPLPQILHFVSAGWGPGSPEHTGLTCMF